MELIKQIKFSQLEARKVRDTARAVLLSTFIAEAEMIGKNANRVVTDAEVTSCLKKFIDNIDFALSHTSGAASTLYEREKLILSQFMPRQMTAEELKNAVIVLKTDGEFTSPKDMGKLMTALKNKYEGTYDGKLASTFVKEVLSNA